MSFSSRSLISAAGLSLTALANAQFTETEANDSKTAANAFSVLAGSTITGNSTGASTTVAGTTSADYFLLNLAAATPGIYQNRLTLASTTAGHTGSIRGLSQAAGVIGTIDSTLQSSSTATTPARFNQFYTFGTAASLNYRVAGTAATTADYTATMSSTLVAPTDIGTFASGSITISTVGRTTVDTDLMILDSSFAPISGYLNDDEATPGATFQSRLTRTYADGVYYLAISSFNTTSNLASPLADERTPSGNVLDFASVIVNSDTLPNLDLDFGLTDAVGTTEITALKAGAYDVNFYKFTVGNPVPEPATMAALGFGALALLRRRRKA